MAVILCAGCSDAFIIDLEEHFSVPLIIQEATKVSLKLRKGDFYCPECERKAGFVPRARP